MLSLLRARGWELRSLKPYGTTKKKKNSGINVSKVVPDIYTENNKILLREMKEDIIKYTSKFMGWKTCYC